MDTNKLIHKHTPTHNFKTFKNDFQKLDGNIQHFDGNIDMSLITKYNYNFNLFNYKPIHKQNTIDNNFINYPDFISIIPLKIFQTWHTLDLPPKMKQNVELLIKQNPEFTHYLYDDKMCRDFIQKHFDEDVLWAFDKLKPGAYKADLWRYCVLYTHGGIYLDIKYNCINNFKLILLTDQECWVKDRSYSICNNIKPTLGIYQAFIIATPRNNILKKSIDLIINNCKNNYYYQNDLSITGPHLLTNFYNSTYIQNLDLSFDGNYILYKNNVIMDIYNEYREEQKYSQGTTTPYIYYKLYWLRVNVFNYPTLKYISTFNFTKTIENEYGTMYSGTPNIIQYNNDYIINLRWINYSYNSNGSKTYIPKQWVSLNSRFIVNNKFEKISKEVFLTEDFSNETNFPGIGIEDIRTFNHDNKIYFLATFFNPDLNRSYVVSNRYTVHDKYYSLNRTYINPTFYNLKKINRLEKNWAMFNYNNSLSVVYDWFPLQIGSIDYNTNTLNIIEKIEMPEFFKNARGSTVGCNYKNEIWFILHKAQNNEKYVPEHYKFIYPSSQKQVNIIYNYQHFFAVFDLNMKLKRHSELFKLGNEMVEFCTGLIMEEKRLILSYSLLDTNSCVSTYDYDTIRNSIKWYFY
jgi:mannosyltransferase OCH1-like enzyme